MVCIRCDISVAVCELGHVMGWSLSAVSIYNIKHDKRMSLIWSTECPDGQTIWLAILADLLLPPLKGYQAAESKSPFKEMLE